MKDLWKELVNSLGFALSVVIVLLFVPMAFTFVMGAFGDAETVFGIIFAILIVGVPIFVFLNKPTQEEKEETLWKEEKKVEPRPKTTFTNKLLETSVEEAERLDIRKREHFENIPKAVYWKYREGIAHTKYDNSFTLKCDILREMEKRPEFSYMFRDKCFYPAIINKSVSKPYGHSPYLILEGAINEHMNLYAIKDRDYLEASQKDKLESMRWAANYVALAGIYAYNKCFSVSLSSDMKEYTLGYPFEVPPLKYQFDCTSEEEEQFFKEAIQRVEDCKIIAKQAFKKGSFTAQNKLFSDYNINKVTVPNFSWEPGTEAALEKIAREWEEKEQKRREAEKYERET